jgi:hypothetical protein
MAALARRIPRAVLIVLALAAAVAVAAQTSTMLAGYSFDEDELASGPDTFSVFEHAKGHVRLSSDFHVSGYRAVKLTDVAGDKDFPELQGYFPVQRHGRLYAHFAFLTTDPRQELNVALAGPRRFTLKPDGIAFWLIVDKQGVLRHMSDSIPKRLADVQPFVWYTVDVDYDLDAGRYALRVFSEATKQAIVDLRDQKNAADHPASAIDVFSFIGDLDDASNVTYYVDDIVIGTSESVRLGPFVAPGRRRLFIQSYLDYERLQTERPTCFPAGDPADLGLTESDRVDAGLMSAVQRALRTGIAAVDSYAARAAAAYQRGCTALAAGQSREAEASFERASTLVPTGRLYRLSAAIAALADRRYDAAADRLADLYPDLYADPRYAVVAGLLSSARGDLPRAEDALRRSGAADLDARAARLYYYVLLRSERYGDAQAWARRQEEASADLRERGRWLERAGDAAFYGGRRDEARAAYRSAAEHRPEAASALLKLSDLAFLDGDFVAERALREHYFGALRSE